MVVLKKGRLLKNNSDLLIKGAEIQSYPWMQFSEENIAFPDNARKSLIRAEVHDSEELKAKITIPEEFRRQLAPKTTPLFPVDLTDDYIMSQEELALQRRRRLLDEEELVTLELQNLAQMGADITGWKEHKEQKEKKVHPETEEQIQNGSKAAVKNNAKSSQKEVVKETIKKTTEQIQTDVKQNSDKPIELINDLNEKSKVNVEPVETLKQTTARVSEQELEEIKNKAWEESYTAGYGEGYSAGQKLGTQEAQAQGHADGHSDGFAEGVREGEEKGLSVLESRSRKYFSTLNDALAEMESLRSHILAAGQDIFIEIAKLCSEKILRSQLRASDEALKALFNAAVESQNEKEFITLEMNPEDASRLRTEMEKDVNHTGKRRIKIKENSDRAVGDFRIEADDAVLTHDISKAVDTLIESLRDDLFSAQEQGVKKAV